MLPHPLIALLLVITPTYATAGSGSDSFLSDTTLVRKDQVQNVLEHEPAQVADCRKVPTGPIETTKCDYETIESVNDELFKHLHELVETPFFRYFRVDLYRECPFWQENGFCMNRECGITTVDESEIPEKWRAAALSKLEMPLESERTTLPGCYYRDSDYCFLDDLSAEGDYVDLSLNPERFTGYAGPSAHRVWRSIYEENCFGVSDMQPELSLLKAGGKSPAPVSLPDTMADAFVGENGEAVEADTQCLEKRVYYKIISGLHASITTHICAEDFDQNTGKWGLNLECFVKRVASHPERLQYIYLNTVLLLRALNRIEPYLSAYDYCSSGTHEEDEQTFDRIQKILGIAREAGRFDETVLFRGENANVLKEEFKAHFRNVTRIMDCVGCDKCRLWGKVQTTGIATALRILFELDDKMLDPKANPNVLQRSELVALINTLHRFSESLHAVGAFRRLWADADDVESARLLKQAEAAARVHPNMTPNAPNAHLGAQPDNKTLVERSVVERLVERCKEGMLECVGVVRSGLDKVGKVFRGSGKEGGLREEL